MHEITKQILLRLTASFADDRVFNTKAGRFKNDLIQLDQKFWLSVDHHVNPTMVVLTDETPEVGGQVAFWMVSDESCLEEITDQVKARIAPSLADLGYSESQIELIKFTLGEARALNQTALAQVGNYSRISIKELI